MNSFYCKYLFILACLINTATDVVAIPNDWSGSGTESDPFIIANAEDMVKLSNIVNTASYETACYEGQYFKLVPVDANGNEIDVLDMSSIANFPSIGVGIGAHLTHTYFAGYFDGNNKTISHLNINSNDDGAGIFGVTYKTCVIKNLTIDETCTITGGLGGAAGIVVQNWGTITNCTNKADISATLMAGGIVASNERDATIEACTNEGNITCERSSAGGIAGSARGCISQCVNYGNVTGAEYVGGIASSCANAGGSAEMKGNHVYSSTITGNRYVGAILGSLNSGQLIQNYYHSGTTVIANGVTYNQDCGLGGKSTLKDVTENDGAMFSSSTEIHPVINNAIRNNDSVYYDLSGRGILNPAKGIYIYNGRKILRK